MTDDIMTGNGADYYKASLNMPTEVERLKSRIVKLEAALKPFADEASVPPMPGEPDDPRRCSMKFLLAAKAALDKSTEPPCSGD